MIKFREALDTFNDSATKPSILLLELYPWIRFLEPPLNIGFQELKAAEKKLKAILLEEIRKHKETIDENDLPRDYTDAYLIEMNKRIKAGNQGTEFRYRFYEIVVLYYCYLNLSMSKKFASQSKKVECFGENFCQFPYKSLYRVAHLSVHDFDC